MPRIRPQLIARLRGEGFITVAEAVAETAINDRTIRKWMGEGRVAIKRIGGLVFVKRASVRAEAGMSPAEEPKAS